MSLVLDATEVAIFCMAYHKNNCIYSCYADSSNKLTPFALVLYRFDQAEDHPVLFKPHGNAKHSRPYQRTRESTKSLLQEELKHSTPKVAVNTVFDKKGGLIAAESAGELPRGRPQAYYTKMKLQEQEMKVLLCAQL